MGHAIGRLSFKKATPKAEIIKECNAWEYRNKDLKEGGIHGIGSQVKFYESTVYNSYEDAYAALDRLTQGSFYPQIAVLYKQQYDFKESAKLSKMKAKLKDLVVRANELATSWNPTEFKSKTIACKKCESKLATAYLNKAHLKRNCCPLCGNDLRPTTIIENEKKLQTRINDLRTEIKNCESEERKNWKKYELCWLIHLETHC